MTEDRRFSEEEFALIIRTASELQEAKPGRSGSGGSSGGLSLADIQAIAAEVGLDPDVVHRAVALVAAGPESGGRSFLGGPVTLVLETAVSGELPDSGLGRTLDVIRRELKHQGEAVNVLESLEWKSENWANPVFVTVTPRDGKTTVRILADRSAAAALGTIFPTLAWIIGTVSVLAGIQPSSLFGITAIVAAGIVGAAATSGAIWLAASRGIEAKVRGLLSVLVREIDALNAGQEPEAPRLEAGEGLED